MFINAIENVVRVHNISMIDGIKFQHKQKQKSIYIKKRKLSTFTVKLSAKI